MKRNIETTFALIGAVIVMIGVLSAANSALADDIQTVNTTAVAIHTASELTLGRGREEISRAASEAAVAIVKDAEIDLDIRLADHHLRLVAANR